jgi:hypothetical protein
MLLQYCCYVYRLYFLTCDKYKSSLRHIHDPVLLLLKMKGIRFFKFRSVSAGKGLLSNKTSNVGMLRSNTKLRSRNHCCRGKAKSVIYFKCGFVSLGIQLAMRNAPYCHLWPVSFYNIFPHYLINGTIFGNKLLNTKCVFWFSLQIFLKHFSF